MTILDKPSALYINIFGSTAQLVWDKVTRNILQQPATVVAYKVYKTLNPNGTGFGSPLATIISTDPYGDIDVSYTDYSASENSLYRVCAWDGVLLGLCTDGYGIPGSGTVSIIPSAGLWDLDLWGV